ncbi:MAG: prepilin-type N-terminal cleavage/methylation domain-containing protein [Planctomycetes bacterium]|nr:prepilin-type N-terminal cleavage/methylation domain-containing protein [Planctomycetota bacterium]
MIRHRAFTLVELLVVLGIVVLLMGLILRSTRGDQREAAVRGAAMELAATMRRVHQRAIATHQTYGIAFNIQNEPGSSGAILNNRSGGHWYRIIGPAKRTKHGRIANSSLLHDFIPWAWAIAHEQQRVVGQFLDFVDDVELSWISDPIVLPPGKVRFLALGDTEEGSRWRAALPDPGWQGPYPPTYPRPWFGYFDPAARKLWAWGGYDPDIPCSGFYYQGLNADVPGYDTAAAAPPIVGCRNPTTRTIDQDWDPPRGGTWPSWDIADRDRNGDGDTADRYEQEVAVPLWKAGEPRPLVNAAWLDAVIIFMPNGSVRFGEWNRARRAYRPGMPDPATGPRGSDALMWGGIADRAKVGHGWSPPDPAPYRPMTTFDQWWGAYDMGEVGHFDTPTGAWRITLAPDVADDRSEFPDAAIALATMLPAWRIAINTYGFTTADRVAHRPGYLASLPAGDAVWPSAPTDWQDMDRINQSCRMGYWHEPASGYYDAPLVPKGHPITTVIDPAMLTRRVWWKTLP